MNIEARQDVPSLPYFRVWMYGPFRVERLVERACGIYQTVQATEWGGSTYPRLLLKALLCCPGRQARRDALIEKLWPEVDPEQAATHFNTATTKLRLLLRPTKAQESLFITENDAALYRLEGQSLIWVDADAAQKLLLQAERCGRTQAEALPLLEEAGNYLGKGVFLQEEEGMWATGRRATMEQRRYRGQIWLSEAYLKQRMLGQAETVLSTLLEEDPLDEDVLCVRFVCPKTVKTGAEQQREVCLVDN